MKSTQDTDIVASAAVRRPQGQVLKGQFVEVLRSEKGKIKGMVLRTTEQTYSIKLPKYLRPVLVRELAPSALVQVWAYPEDDRWRGINVMPLEEPEAIALREQLGTIEATADSTTVASQPELLRVQVCCKGKCFKQGGRQVLQSLQSEVAENPDLQHVAVEAVGCMKACKKGPNIRLSNSHKVISGVTPQKALSLISQQS